MLKVAVIGCGRIADAHVSQIQRIQGCEIVGVCDRELLMAEQLAQRFSIQRCFSDVEELLAKARPDVVHVATPPASHFDIAKRCFERNCHVYVEKPFTLYAEEASELLEEADERHLKVTVGHDDQFSHAARRMRRLIQSGFLGGPPVHMDSYYCYEIGPSGYSAAVLGDKRHWVRRLPGRLLHNIISHGIARIAEFLVTDSPQVCAHGFTSPALKAIGETEIKDELRAFICENESMTAHFTFSSQMRPSLHEFRIYGPKNGLVLDHDQQTVITLRGARFPSYAEKFLPPVILAQQYLGNACMNVGTFLARDFHMKSGMKYLIESFYRAIIENTPVPIPYRQILLTARIMDEIFSQIHKTQAEGELHEAVAVAR